MVIEVRCESAARCLEVDLARASVVGVADEQTDVADDRRLVGEIVEVALDAVGGARAGELGLALDGLRQALDVGGELGA